MAADSLDVSVKLTITGNVQKSWNSGRSADTNIDLGELFRFLTGTGVDQADTVYVVEQTLASAATLSLDMSGSLKGPAGEAAVFAELVGVILINRPMDGDADPNTTTLQIGGGSSCVALFADLTDKSKPINPGGGWMHIDPSAGGICTVTAGTADILTVTNASGASNTFQLIVIGRSA